jgi:hypothetical protein
LLGEAGVLVVESDLLEIDLENIPGKLSCLCKKLLDMGINIEYAYGSTVPNCSKGAFYLRVLNTPKVMEALEKCELK